MRTSVGCPSRCSFCVVHFLANGKYLQRDVEDVVNEIAALPQEYVYFVDDETFINTKRMRRMAELLIEKGIQKEIHILGQKRHHLPGPGAVRTVETSGPRVRLCRLRIAGGEEPRRLQQECDAVPESPGTGDPA